MEEVHEIKLGTRYRFGRVEFMFTTWDVWAEKMPDPWSGYRDELKVKAEGVGLVADHDHCLPYYDRTTDEIRTDYDRLRGQDE